MLRLQVVGSNVERYRCPHCGSNDRERHLRLYFDRLGLWNVFADAKVLHIAPERKLSDVINTAGPALYIRGDLYPEEETIREVDLENVKFPNETFDFVICNHVLEHVADLSTVLSEVHRVLRPRGRFVCQTPYAARLSRTLEEPFLQSETDRRFFYGQADHVRLFGLDIERTIREAGFEGRLTPHSELLPEIDPERMGVNEKEPFFDFVRV
jgi:SAM-dependent methyltransferase